MLDEDELLGGDSLEAIRKRKMKRLFISLGAENPKLTRLWQHRKDQSLLTSGAGSRRLRLKTKKREPKLAALGF